MGRFLEMVGWGGQLGGIQNQPGGFDEKRLVTLSTSQQQAWSSGAMWVIKAFIFPGFWSEILQILSHDHDELATLDLYFGEIS